MNNVCMGDILTYLSSSLDSKYRASFNLSRKSATHFENSKFSAERGTDSVSMSRVVAILSNTENSNLGKTHFIIYQSIGGLTNKIQSFQLRMRLLCILVPIATRLTDHVTKVIMGLWRREFPVCNTSQNDVMHSR